MTTAFTSWMWLLKTRSNKVCSFSLFSPLFQSEARTQAFFIGTHGKSSSLTSEKANDLIYKGAFKQQSNLIGCIQHVPRASSGHILPSLSAEITDEIKNMKKVQTPDFDRRPWTSGTTWFRASSVGATGTGTRVVDRSLSGWGSCF